LGYWPVYKDGKKIWEKDKNETVKKLWGTGRINKTYS
jgi:hypothetical protein